MFLARAASGERGWRLFLPFPKPNTTPVIAASQLALSLVPSVAAATTPAPKTRWLISQKDDLIYLLGSSGVSYALMVLLFVFKVKPATIFWLYVTLLDDPHVFATFSRTYADPEEWQKRRTMLIINLLWFLPGPIAIRLGLGTYFDIIAYSWAYYHIVKQHYGFSILYKKKNDDLAKLDNLLDKALIWTGFAWPYINFLFKGDFPALVKLRKSLPAWLPQISTALFGLSLLGYSARQVYKVKTGMPINLPKQLLLAASLSVHNVTLRLPFHKLDGGVYNLACIAAIITSFHNIQYDRLIWFHNKNKYVQGAKEGKNYGLATLLSKDWKILIAAGVAFASLYRIPLGQMLNRIPIGEIAGEKQGIQQVGRYLRAAGWGFAFIHYYLDSKIWRIRRDPVLNQNLKMAGNQA